MRITVINVFEVDAGPGVHELYKKVCGIFIGDNGKRMGIIIENG